VPDDLGERIRQRIVDGVESDIVDDASDWGARRKRTRARSSRLFFAIFLIAAGTLLFLGNIGLLPIHDVWDYWPLGLIALGIGRLFTCANASARIWSVLMIVFGVFFLLLNFGVFHVQDGSWWLSLLLIALGVSALMKVLDPDAARKRPVGFPDGRWSTSSDNLLKDTAIFAEIKRKIDSPNFQGGAANAVFGSVVLNLRRAQISPADHNASVEANAVFGSVKIRVPENWRVDIQGAAVLGAYSDKTLPPTTPDLETPTLIVSGYSVFGSVEIEN